MNRFVILFFFAFSLLFGACNFSENTEKHPIKRVLQSINPKIKNVTDSLHRHEVQILFTQIDRNEDHVQFIDYEFQVDAQAYFYPASTIKFPTAVIALEKISAADSLKLDSRYALYGDSIVHSFAQDITNIFAVSDNHANNRLYAFLSPDTVNQNMHQRGISNFRLTHRLGTSYNAPETRPLLFIGDDGKMTETTPMTISKPTALNLKKVKKGIGYYEKDSLIKQPFDFSKKNYYPIETQHATLKRIIFPETFPDSLRFKIDNASRELLLRVMHQPPRKLGYDPDEFYDGFCKFFMFGDTHDRIPDHIQIYNKVGYAYGTLTDCAYIKDSLNDIEFMLTATILVNRDRIFNDDHYEYQTIGIPFLAELGRQLYAQEVQRKKK